MLSLLLQTVVRRSFPPARLYSKYGRPELDAQQRVGSKVLNKAQKPHELYRWIFKKFTPAKASILSLCEGSGTACVAALVEGHSVTGVDYCAEMVNYSYQRVHR